MLHSVPSPQDITMQTVRTELRRLYLRRSAIDRLMQALELYGRQADASAPETAKFGPRFVTEDSRLVRARVI